MFLSLPELQKERGFPHPSRKKKLLKLKRESTHCSVCFEFVQIVVGDLQSLQRWVGHFAFVLHKIVLHVPVMTRCRKQLLPIDGPEASFCVGVFVLGVEGCRDMIARHQILDV